ncbi:MAG: hypothetical protein AVDCRST_MAG47-2113, partial [uncultured Nocardioidaceae bacterium]
EPPRSGRVPARARLPVRPGGVDPGSSSVPRHRRVRPRLSRGLRRPRSAPARRQAGDRRPGRVRRGPTVARRERHPCLQLLQVHRPRQLRTRDRRRRRSRRGGQRGSPVQPGLLLARRHSGPALRRHGEALRAAPGRLAALRRPGLVRRLRPRPDVPDGMAVPGARGRRHAGVRLQHLTRCAQRRRDDRRPGAVVRPDVPAQRDLGGARTAADPARIGCGSRHGRAPPARAGVGAADRRQCSLPPRAPQAPRARGGPPSSPALRDRRRRHRGAVLAALEPCRSAELAGPRGGPRSRQPPRPRAGRPALLDPAEHGGVPDPQRERPHRGLRHDPARPGHRAGRRRMGPGPTVVDRARPPHRDVAGGAARDHGADLLAARRRLAGPLRPAVRGRDPGGHVRPRRTVGPKDASPPGRRSAGHARRGRSRGVDRQRLRPGVGVEPVGGLRRLDHGPDVGAGGTRRRRGGDGLGGCPGRIDTTRSRPPGGGAARAREDRRM